MLKPDIKKAKQAPASTKLVEQAPPLTQKLAYRTEKRN